MGISTSTFCRASRTLSSGLRASSASQPCAVLRSKTLTRAGRRIPGTAGTLGQEFSVVRRHPALELQGFCCIDSVDGSGRLSMTIVVIAKRTEVHATDSEQER